MTAIVKRESLMVLIATRWYCCGMGMDAPKAAAHLERAFGRLIRDLRHARGWSQTDLAERLEHLGFEYHQTTIGKLEAGARPLRVGELFAVAEVFGVPARDLVDAVTGYASLTEEDAEVAARRIQEIEEESAQARADLVEAVDAYAKTQLALDRRRAQSYRALAASDDRVDGDADPLGAFVLRERSDPPEDQ